MAVDLHIAVPAEEDGDPLVHLPGVQDLDPHAAGQDVEVGDGAGDGAAHFDLNLEPYDSDEVDEFYAADEAANFYFEEEEADEDADVYADDFHVMFQEEDVQVNDEEDDAVNAPNEAANFDLNIALEEDGLEGSSDEEHVEHGSQTQNARTVVGRNNLSDEVRQQIYEA
ncbi:hypothetical protein EJB05_00399, partial [Eragrostis curvula]